MNSYPELPDWDLKASLAGTCRHCGADLSGEMRVRATPDWVARYYADEAFRRTINHSIALVATARHERICAGQRIGEHVGGHVGERLSERLGECIGQRAGEQTTARRRTAWAISA